MNDNTFAVPAVMDMDILIAQAHLLYKLSQSMEAINKDEATLLMGAAAMLYHLHNGRFIMTEVRSFSNREVY